MNLKSGSLYWPTTLPNPPRYPKLDRDLTCDVLILGAGESGSNVAYHLAGKGLDVAVVERREVGMGSSAANTGMVQYANDKTLTSCIHSFGDAGLRFYELCLHAVQHLLQLVQELRIDPQVYARPSLYYATEAKDLPGLMAEYQALAAHGFPASYWDAEAIRRHFPFTKSGGIWSVGDAEANPYRLSHALIDHAQSRGAQIYEETEIVGRKHLANEVHLWTKEGHRIVAKHVVYAAGYEAQAFKREKNAVLLSTYAIVTNPVESLVGWPDRALIWETARPYLYMRTSADGRIIMGGLDEPTTDATKRDSMLPRKTEQLLLAVQKLFPQITELRAEYAWSASFGDMHDGLPMIGRYEEFPHTLFVLGYGGNGTVYSVILAQIIRDLIIKGSHPDQNLFLSDERPYLHEWSRPLDPTLPGVPPTLPGLQTSSPEWS
ncbi:MAG TPA: FAD-dependent oxidoreductase [Symbiobacteriaceae bacterium]|nr:FAD-dependent oxidoreductase [Symbiobacteriaceae bacterium]